MCTSFLSLFNPNTEVHPTMADNTPTTTYMYHMTTHGALHINVTAALGGVGGVIGLLLLSLVATIVAQIVMWCKRKRSVVAVVFIIIILELIDLQPI